MSTLSDASKDMLKTRVQARLDLLMLKMRAERAAQSVALGRGARLAAGIGRIDALDVDSVLPPGVNVLGFLRGDLGLGVHARAVARALEASGVPVGGLDFGFDLRNEQSDTSCEHLLRDGPDYRANLFCINADTLMYCHELRQEMFAGRYNIHYGAWELAEYPADWMPAMNLVHEMWTISRFVQQSAAASSTVPVINMGLPVELPPLAPASRRAFGLPENRFLFLFAYDINSMTERKNPAAVLRAFARAFPRHAEVGLVIKVNYIASRPAHREKIRRLKEEWAHDPRIVILDRVLPYERMLALASLCDAYVSLHRAEGFGLGMAEAMALGRPVIATGYSGNLDFTRPHNACLVDYTLVPVPRGHYMAAEHQVWAEADTDHAAHYMRALAENRALYERLAGEGQRTIVREFSRRVIGGKIRKRLELLGIIA